MGAVDFEAGLARTNSSKGVPPWPSLQDPRVRRWFPDLANATSAAITGGGTSWLPHAKRSATAGPNVTVSMRPTVLYQRHVGPNAKNQTNGPQAQALPTVDAESPAKGQAPDDMTRLCMRFRAPGSVVNVASRLTPTLGDAQPRRDRWSSLTTTPPPHLLPTITAITAPIGTLCLLLVPFRRPFQDPCPSPMSYGPSQAMTEPSIPP